MYTLAANAPPPGVIFPSNAFGGSFPAFVPDENTHVPSSLQLTPYPSGELVVQTPNAAFALVYLGAVDSNDQIGIPTSVQGWWLMEV